MIVRTVLLWAVISVFLAQQAKAQKTPQSGAPDDWPLPVHDSQIFTFFQADRTEYRMSDGDDGYLLETQAWIGTDSSKFWAKMEGEGLNVGGLEIAEFQALYSHMITPFFDFQAGLRQDMGPGPSRIHAVVGFQGLAPYWFEIDSALFLSEKGHVSARFEAEYELLFTQRLIGQPRVELNLAAQDVEDLGIGAGLSTTEVGFRLRYEIRRQIAPYVGVSWERALGDTADFVRAEGDKVSELFFVFGVRLWF